MPIEVKWNRVIAHFNIHRINLIREKIFDLKENKKINFNQESKKSIKKFYRKTQS